MQLLWLWMVVCIGGSLVLATEETLARLTHVVMPFHPRQAEQAIGNLQTWSHFRPCATPANVTMIFFMSNRLVAGLEERLLMIFDSMPRMVRMCFNEARVEVADLGRDDTYLKGSRLMFEWMLSGRLQFGQVPSHVLYMEPDCRPVRRLWLDVVQRLVAPPQSKFWVKGSIFRGQEQVIPSPDLHNHVHINGNALYNVGDGALRRFYFDKVRPFIQTHYRYEGAYDMDLYKYLLWNNTRATARYFHLFQFSDFVQNMWHSDYSFSQLLAASPDTVLLHGGEAHV